MIDDEPSVKDMARLWKVCTEYVRDAKITSQDMLYDSDFVAETATELVRNVCDEVGYYEEPEHDEYVTPVRDPRRGTLVTKLP